MTDLDQHPADDGPAPLSEADAPASASAPAPADSPVDGERKVPLVMAEPKDRAPGEVQSNPIGLVFIAGLFAMLWFWAGPRYFFVVVGLVIMIFLHELGHYMTARWTGMKATQFFLFMGPRIWSFQRGETEYGIRSLPVGAFVRIVGMHNLDPYDPADADRAYMNKSYPRRMLVITAGSMMHFIQAILLFLVVTTAVGLDNPDRWSIGQVSRLTTGETPSVVAELEPGDTIVEVDGVVTTNWVEMRDYIRDNPGREVSLTVLSDGETSVRSTTLATLTDEEGDDYGFLGVSPTFEHTRGSPWLAFEMFGETFWQALKSIPVFLSPSTFAELGQLMFSGSEQVDRNSDEALERPISVVGAVRIAGDPDFDIAWPITMLAILNIFIGILNLVPLLPLDGGHAAVATYERIRSRRGRPYHADIAKLLPLTYAVVGVLAFVMISTVYLDIVRPIN